MTRSGKGRGGGREGWWVGPIYGDNAQIKFTRRRSRKLCDVKTRIKGARESWKGDAVSLTFRSKSCCFVWENYYPYQTLGHAVVRENFINKDLDQQGAAAQTVSHTPLFFYVFVHC